MKSELRMIAHGFTVFPVGKLDIQGYGNQCPTWEKLEAVGPEEERLYDPCDSEGNCIDLTVEKPCAQSQSHTDNMGRYVVWCRVRETSTLNSGNHTTRFKFTSLQPESPPPFVPPIDENQALHITIKSSCRRASQYLRKPASRC